MASSNVMGEWISASERSPPRGKLCDFLYPGYADEEKIWILCSCKVGETGWYRGEWKYWREAENLPGDVDEYEH